MEFFPTKTFVSILTSFYDKFLGLSKFFCFLYSLPLNIGLLDSPALLETTIDGVIGTPDTVETLKPPDEINIAPRQPGLEENEVEGRSK